MMKNDFVLVTDIFKMPMVTISDSDLSIVLEVDAKYQLHFAAVKQYFPSADGLTYKREGKTCGVTILNNIVQCKEDVDNYYVHYNKSGKGL